jgi:murein peptide amidase A
MNGDFHWPDFLPAFRLAARQAGFQSNVIAETAAGPIEAWQRSGCGPRVYVSSGIHGDEPAGPLALLELMERGFFPESSAEWAICPALNPTGLLRGTRDNADGIDLNRDYWNQSTLETKAHVAWLDSWGRPDLFLSLHEDWDSVGFYFYEINLEHDFPQRADAILKAVSPWFVAEPGPEIDGHIARGSGWIYHAAEADVPDGWPEAIYLSNSGCPLSFTFETPSSAKLEDRIAAQIAAVNAALKCVGCDCL